VTNLWRQDTVWEPCTAPGTCLVGKRRGYPPVGLCVKGSAQVSQGASIIGWARYSYNCWDFLRRNCLARVFLENCWAQCSSKLLGHGVFQGSFIVCRGYCMHSAPLWGGAIPLALRSPFETAVYPLEYTTRNRGHAVWMAGPPLSADPAWRCREKANAENATANAVGNLANRLHNLSFLPTEV